LLLGITASAPASIASVCCVAGSSIAYIYNKNKKIKMSNNYYSFNGIAFIKPLHINNYTIDLFYITDYKRFKRNSLKWGWLQHRRLAFYGLDIPLEVKKRFCLN
jgi:hypothetical protein